MGLLHKIYIHKDKQRDGEGEEYICICMYVCLYIYNVCVIFFLMKLHDWSLKIHRVVEKLEYTGKSWCYNLVSKTMLEAEDFFLRGPNT